jgi:hypothetical protein
MKHRRITYERDGKMTYDHFRKWASKNRIVLDSRFNGDALSWHTDRLEKELQVIRLSGSHQNKSPRRSTSRHSPFIDMTHDGGELAKCASLLPDCSRYRIILLDPNSQEVPMKGVLYKHGKTFKNWETRYFIIRDQFLYQYKTKEDFRFLKWSDSRFLVGCYVHSFVNEERQKVGISEKSYGIRLQWPNEEIMLFTDSQDSQTNWIRAFTQAAEMRNLRDFYVMAEMIGKGCYATVHRAVCIKTGENYAIKAIRKADLVAEERECLRQEIARHKLASHPNIVKLIDVFDTADILYLILELMRGEDLLSRIERLGAH